MPIPRIFYWVIPGGRHFLRTVNFDHHSLKKYTLNIVYLLKKKCMTDKVKFSSDSIIAPVNVSKDIQITTVFFPDTFLRISRHRYRRRFFLKNPKNLTTKTINNKLKKFITFS